jgi:DNA-binding NtrC family response regulator
MRYRVKNWIERRVGRPLLLIGISATLFELELFVEQACRSTLPVLLTGEFGTEKALLAASIHSSGTRAIGPFVEVTVSSPELLPAQWFDRARGGTLFLNGIDELTSEQQSKLSQCLPSRLGQWFTTNGAQEVRLIASTTQDLRKLVSEGKFSRALLAELDFLSATVPPLRERREDIPYHVYSLLERSGWLTTPECQEMLLDACCRHSWPENLFELEQMIVRLAVMTNGRVIDEVDLRRYAPALPKSRSPSTLIDESAGAAEGASTDMRSQLEHWVRCALSGNVDALSRLHGGLKKALLYIGEHYADPISLADLAHNAHLSQSHLSFLFRTVLGASFKSVLSAIRLEQAKLSLKTDPLARITEVAHSVGYGDLSHFERSFRRVVGKTPREYRQSVSLNSAYDAIGPLTNGRVATAPA